MYDRGRFTALMRNEADMAYKRRARIVLDLLDIQPDESVFECGCGLGFNLLLLHELFQCRLTGLEVDESRLRRALRQLRAFRIRLLRGNVYALPFRDAEFDKILMAEVLEHLDDEMIALAELKRVLRPGGTLVITVPHSNYPFLWDPINKTRQWLQLSPIRRGPLAGIWANHVRLYQPDQFCAVVESAGFHVTTLRQETHYCCPFAHQLVYCVGKPLVESGICAHADRFRFDAPHNIWGGPLRLGLQLFNWIDRWNDPPRYHTTYVSLILRAIKRL